MYYVYIFQSVCFMAKLNRVRRASALPIPSSVFVTSAYPADRAVRCGRVNIIYVYTGIKIINPPMFGAYRARVFVTTLSAINLIEGVWPVNGHFFRLVLSGSVWIWIATAKRSTIRHQFCSPRPTGCDVNANRAHLNRLSSWGWLSEGARKWRTRELPNLRGLRCDGAGTALKMSE